MNSDYRKTDKLINYIPVISGIALICLGVSTFDNIQPTDIFLNNGLLSLSYPLLFMYTGYKYGLVKNDESSQTTVVSQLKFAGVFYALVAIVTLLSTIATEGGFGALIQVSLIFTAGIPNELWFVPAGVISVLAFRKLNKKFRTETIVKISVLFFLFSLIITTYGGLPIPFLNTMQKSAEAIFAGSHCGVFSAMLFVSLGVNFSEKGKADKAKKHALVLLISLFLMIMEIALLSLKSDIKNPVFFLSSVPAAVSIFYLVSKVPEMRKGMDCITNTGAVILFIGQLLCSICNKITGSKDFLFADLFSSTSEKLEVIILITLIIAFAVQAFFSKERWIDEFSYFVQSTVLFILRPFAYIMTAFGTKIKNVLLVISFGVLPVLLWLFERGINTLLCSGIFICCLVVIILCSLSYPMKAEKKNHTVFSIFFFTVVILYLSAELFNNFAYSQTGRMLLYFFVPLAVIMSNRKDFLPELLKNYTTGIYLSFSLFVAYCLMFRPYDITRYTGAFCNSNMCGLYLVVVCVVALSNIPCRFSKKDFSENVLHWIVFGVSFGFVLLTISRTAFAGAFVAVFVKICTMSMRGSMKNTTALQKMKAVLKTAVPFVIIILSGLTVSYLSVRFIPGFIGRPEYLIYEIENQMEYKVPPGAGIWDKEYVSPLRFLQAWLNRSVGYESINNMSTGRIDIYLEYLSRLSFSGHIHERIRIEGESLPMLAHNVFLQTAYNCGIIAGVIYLIYLVFCFVYGIHRYLKKDDFSVYTIIGISAYAVCGMFESMEGYYYPLLFTALMGLFPLICTRCEPDFQNQEISSELLIEQTNVKQRMQKMISIIVIMAICITFVYFVFEASSNPNKYILNEMLK